MLKDTSLLQLSLFAAFRALKYTVCLYILNIFYLYRFNVINAVFIYYKVWLCIS